ncbi:hypothetical protein [Arthrobacter sp. NPDC093139]|uniref:hypothetical protein n=1 Tax=Arthrobacter sp. NPDC093139 TaxID=3363945 RepID=UPI0038092509
MSPAPTQTSGETEPAGDEPRTALLGLLTEYRESIVPMFMGPAERDEPHAPEEILKVPPILRSAAELPAAADTGLSADGPLAGAGWVAAPGCAAGAGWVAAPGGAAGAGWVAALGWVTFPGWAAGAFWTAGAGAVAAGEKPGFDAVGAGDDVWDGLEVDVLEGAGAGAVVGRGVPGSVGTGMLGTGVAEGENEGLVDESVGAGEADESSSSSSSLPRTAPAQASRLRVSEAAVLTCSKDWSASAAGSVAVFASVFDGVTSPASSRNVWAAALDAGTPADKTSTAPSATAAVPRRSPPWLPVSVRKFSDF